MLANQLKRYAAVLMTKEDSIYPRNSLFSIEHVNINEREVEEYCAMHYPACSPVLITELFDNYTHEMVLTEYELMLDEQTRMPDEYGHNMAKGG